MPEFVLLFHQQSPVGSVFRTEFIGRYSVPVGHDAAEVMPWARNKAAKHRETRDRLGFYELAEHIADIDPRDAPTTLPEPSETPMGQEDDNPQEAA